MRLCVVCKAPIDAERIEAIPETRLCTEHGRQIQKHGGEFVVSATQERTSKPGSLKLNY
jgi:RNA polymerase-binding transcription factor DksA